MNKRNVTSIQCNKYQRTMKSNETLTQATTWMSLENIMLIERSRHTKPPVILFHLYEMSRIQIHRDKK
jgi:hypothetical protein